MDLHTTVPSSSDGGYDLGDLANSKMGFAVDPEAMPTDEVGNGPALEAALGQTYAADAVTTETKFALTPVPDPEPDPEPSRSSTPPPGGGDQPPPPEVPATKAADAGPKLRRKRRLVKKRSDIPAWAVSALIHVGILGVLAAMATTSGDVVKRLINIDGSTVLNNGSAEELTKIYADPTDVRSDQAVGDPDSSVVGPDRGFSSNGASPLGHAGGGPDRPARQRADQPAHDPGHLHALGPRLDLRQAQPRPRRRRDGRRRRHLRRRRRRRGARPDRPRDPPPPHPAQGDRRLAVRRVREHEGRPEGDPQEVRPGRQRAQDQHARRRAHGQGQEEVDQPADEPRHRRLRRRRPLHPGEADGRHRTRSARPSSTSRSTRPAKRTP